MARMIGPQGMRSLSVTGADGRKKVLNASADGTFNVNNPKLIKKLKEEGLGVAGTASATTSFKGGFNCKKCGFGSFFKKCGKCGEIND